MVDVDVDDVKVPGCGPIWRVNARAIHTERANEKQPKNKRAPSARAEAEAAAEAAAEGYVKRPQSAC